MTLSEWDGVEAAIQLAVEAHHGQRDKAGMPYVLHVLRIMHNVEDPITKQAAVLHDYLEDTDGTVQELEQRGIHPQAIQAIQQLTRDKSVSYSEYVIALSSNSIAKTIKLTDLNDNYRLDRVAYRPKHRQEDAKRIQRYILSSQFLRGELDEEAYRSSMAPLER